MERKRQVEIFSADCPLCAEKVELVQQIACDSCEVTVLDINNDDAARRAAEVGVTAVPAVAVDGKLASCCEQGGISEEALRAEGIGQPM